MSESLLSAAQKYAKQGWPVLPLQSVIEQKCSCRDPLCDKPGKHPRTLHGLHDASTDLDQIGRWWTQWPDANIGLRTGDAFDVLDVDGQRGAAILMQKIKEHGELPPCPMVKTGKGMHLYFLPTGIGNKVRYDNELDWRGKNGYVVAPPSIHIYGEPYQWEVETELSEAPEWLLPVRKKPELEPPIPILRILTNDNTRYGEAALAKELEELSRAREGMRNDQLNRSAFALYQLVAGGELIESQVTEDLYSIAESIGLLDTEIRRTLDSARQGGFEKPRRAPDPLIQPAIDRHPSSQAIDDPIVPKKHLFKVRTIEEVYVSPPGDPSYIVKGLISPGEQCVIAAPRGIGKSWFGMNLSVLLGNGEGLLGGSLEIDKQLNVLYCQGELNEDESARRWMALCGTHPAPGVYETFDRFRIRIKRITREQDGPFGKERQDHVDAIIDDGFEETIANNNIGLVVIDPWAVYFAGNENSNDETEAALDKLRDLTLRYGVAVVILHHITNKGERGQKEPEDLWRGATRLADWASTRVTMLPHYTQADSEELVMTREEARRYVDVSFLRRSTPLSGFSMHLNYEGWWVPFTVTKEEQMARYRKVELSDVLEEMERSGPFRSFKNGLERMSQRFEIGRRRLETLIEIGKSQNRIIEIAGERGAISYAINPLSV